MIKNKNLEINFYNYESNNIFPEKFADEIIKAIKKDKNQNVVGYNKISYLKDQLLYLLGNKSIKSSRIDEKKNDEIENCIVNFLTKFQKELKLKYKPIRFYIYPWFPESKVSKDFGGVNAVVIGFTTMHLFVDYKNFSIKHLEETLAHELNHLYFYQAHDTGMLNIKESIIAEGLAEHFREYFVGGKIAPWSKALTEKKILESIPKLTPYFDSYDRNIYNSIFYGAGDFQNWTGYSVGYLLVKKMITKLKTPNWKKIMNMPVDIFFKK